MFKDSGNGCTNFYCACAGTRTFKDGICETCEGVESFAALKNILHDTQRQVIAQQIIIEQMCEVLTTRAMHSDEDCPVCKILELVKKMEN